ncbi:exosortase N [Marinigracilibium pacificum]|uniref:Exosortase N n=1 Tax=Marinigracilibium pacificum TaxID=2729599 RepID=A0A848IUS6_9BACT|nr:exosortase N [Marinigracilibium pacificum]NMM48253.1 exosortase N [Marinigracilibium pacificum]
MYLQRNLIEHRKMLILAVISAFSPLVLFILLEPEYLIKNTFFWICIATFPLSIGNANKKSNTFFYFALILGIINLFFPTSIGLFIIAIFFLLVMCESFFGVNNISLIIHAFLISPLFLYINSLISFPLRLKLTEITSWIISKGEFEVSVNGNLVNFDGSEFLIDEACAGINMLGYGLLTGSLLIAYFHRKNPFSNIRTFLYYIILLFLILSANIVRITLIILFKILPEVWLHEGLGIFIYVFQVILPFYLILTLFDKDKIKDEANIYESFKFPTLKYSMLATLFALGIYFSTVQDINFKTSVISIPGSSILESGTVKIENDNSLIYLKPPVPAYKADHTPAVCWKGSGYIITTIDSREYNDISINVGKLEKGKDQLFTAWWFESKQNQTGSEWEWRKTALSTNEKFYLINITCNTQEELDSEIISHLNQKLVNSYSR